MHNPFLFACGVPRSGTTLLQRMLDHHPELAVANDSHFIPRALELTDKSLIQQAQAGLEIELTDELATNVRDYHRFWRLGIDGEEFELVRDKSETFQQLVSGLYGLLAQKQNKRFAGEKTPDYVRRLPMLQGLFPCAKMIHLVRDGRDVALSLLQWASPKKGPGRIPLWDDDPVAVCAMWWRWLVMASREKAIASAHYLEIHYEDLVRDPETTTRQVCDFLDLEFSEQMMDYHRGKSQQKNNCSAKSAWLAPQTGLRDWRTDMESEQVQLFEVLASDALREFGYELGNKTLSKKTVDAGKRYRQWWDRHFLTKHKLSHGDPGSVEFELKSAQPGQTVGTYQK